MLKQVIVHRRLTVYGPLRGYANVGVKLNGTALGPSQTITTVGACDYNVGRYSYPGEYSASGTPAGYVRGGTNVVSTTVVSACCPVQSIELVHDNIEPPTYEFRYSLSTDAIAVSGTPQVGIISHPAEQKLVVRTVGPTEAPAPSQQVLFEFVSQPPNAAGAAIGGAESATSPTYTVTSDSAGEVTATVVLGNKEGDYTIKASLPNSPGGASAEFVITAKKPDRIRIVQDSPYLSMAKDSYVVSLLHQPNYFAIGVDTNGVAIGRVRCNWAIAASGPAAGGASVDPAERTGQTAMHPSAIGKVKLSANPALTGVGTAKVDVLIGGVFLDVDGNLTSANVHDDLPRFVPGSKLTGESLPLPTSADEAIQTVKLHVLNGRSRGSVTFTLTDVSNYPGLTMNHPIDNPTTAFDFDFGPAADPSCAESLCVTVPFSDSGDTSTTLYVRDYAARGKVTARITIGQDTYLQEIRLPEDKTANLLPDAGWYALQNAVTGEMLRIPDTALTAAGDVDDNPPGSGDPVAGRIGDGLTNFEEFRGFAVDGRHRRLNPHRKDLFVRRGADLVGLSDWILKMPMTFAFIRADEAVGDLHPLVNPNRTGISGATAQHGVRIRTRNPAPPAIFNGVTYTAEQFGAYGYTFHAGESTSVMNIDANLPLGSPNETLVVEIYPASFGNDAIFGGSDGLQTTPAGDDVVTQINNTTVILTGTDAVLNSVPCDGASPCNDIRTDMTSSSCTATDVVFMTEEQVEEEKRSTVAHETGHAVDIEHNGVPCTTSIMRLAGYLSAVNDFTAHDVNQIRVHRKP